MQVNRINMINYNSRISFGEAEGPQYLEEYDYISSRQDYENRVRNINYKYNSKRKWLLENNPNQQDSVFFKNAVKNIEDLRAKALDELEKLFRKSFPVK